MHSIPSVARLHVRVRLIAIAISVAVGVVAGLLAASAG
jgi:hypothetical protein